MLSLQNITKRFPGVLALDNVCLELEPGKVTALIGENGAGKSTLMKILSGVYKDYEGQIILNGKQVKFANTKQAQESGISIIHQELNLIPHLSITENIFLGRELITPFGLLNKKEMQLQTQLLLQKLELHVSPNTPIYQLKVGQQQVVEIAKALLVDSDVIIMDEPTSAISESEVAVLFNIITDLKRGGKTMVYISHKMDELFKIADQFFVLRDGKTICTGSMQGMTEDQLIQQMVGREIKINKKKSIVTERKELLSVSNITLKNPATQSDILKDISFNVGNGEIVGIFGLMGAGRTELLETLFGLHPKTSSGQVLMDGKKIALKSPTDAINAGLALVPEDRKKDGIIAGLDVKKNIGLTTLQNAEQFGILNGNKEITLAAKYIQELAIKTSSQAQLAGKLSGGNQQKIVLAKWLATKPKVLMLDEPTRGIDINAKNEIYKLMIQLAESGLGIIMVSSELPEIFAVSDRVLVLSEGSLTATLPIAEATENSLLKAAIKQIRN